MVSRFIIDKTGTTEVGKTGPKCGNVKEHFQSKFIIISYSTFDNYRITTILLCVKWPTSQKCCGHLFWTLTMGFYFNESSRGYFIRIADCLQNNKRLDLVVVVVVGQNQWWIC